MKNKLIILASLLSFSALNAMERTEAEYQSMSPARKNYLQQHAYREVLNPHSSNYQPEVIELLRDADLLSGAGRTFSINQQGTPYPTTAEDKQIAYDIFTFVKNSPPNTINDSLEEWAFNGYEYFNFRNLN